MIEILHCLEDYWVSAAFLKYLFMYFVVEDSDLSLIESDRQALEERDIVLSPLLFVVVTLGFNGFHYEGLTENEIDPYLIFEVYKE